MRTIKRLLAAGLAVATLVSVPAFAAETDGLEHFQPVAAYSDELFTDLDPNGWYMENVETAYELGLMKGVGSGSFSPDGTISLGETIALAARVHSIYETGAASFTQGSPWYQVYVDYAARNGIFTGSAATDYGAPATRSQFAAILASALPEEALEPINTVDDGMIPDVPVGAADYDAIYLLYRAGVLTGSDGRGTYNPQTTIGRSSVAALVTRMVRPELRQSITLADPDKEVSVTLNRTSLSLTEGETYRLTATVRPSDADVSVSWSSSSTSVASVSSDGTVTAKAKGTATITATAGDASARCTVTVEAEEVEDGGVRGLTLRPNTMVLLIGQTDTFTYVYNPEDAAPPKVTWHSSNPSVATIDSNGVVTAVSAGKTQITATAHNGVTSPPRNVEVLEDGDGFVDSDPPFDVPKMNYNYGPMTTVDKYSYPSTYISRAAQITDFEFTGWSSYSSMFVHTVNLKVHLEGTLINPGNSGGSSGCDIRILFYDANGNKLAFSGPITIIAKDSGPFSCEDEIGPINLEILKNTAYIEFIDPDFSGYVEGEGTKVIPGIVSYEEAAKHFGLDYPNAPEPEPALEPELRNTIGQALMASGTDSASIINELNEISSANSSESNAEHFQNAMEHLELFKSRLTSVLQGCNGISVLAECKTLTEDLLTQTDQALEYFGNTEDISSPDSAALEQAKALIEDIVPPLRVLWNTWLEITETNA